MPTLDRTSPEHNLEQTNQMGCRPKKAAGLDMADLERHQKQLSLRTNTHTAFPPKSKTDLSGEEFPP
ncbi:hypothetical protein GN956_G99 [Arapaima gigas]